ncbi:hypothetical protein EMPS_11510 [Entomortierella parvispora]|uniref:Uncharacterized protein n=1 Tax=Entomortierella parvispora TaxID=205924 RepID=A0A9P3M205_9FUNG|nr:hypothetical protein EMPS_11510 [Entomortierella parvispora]
MPDPSTSRVYNRSRDPVLLKSIYKFRPLVQVLHLEFFAGAYLQHFVDSPLYKTPFAQPYNPQASDPKCSPPKGLVSLRIMTGLSQDGSYLTAHDAICSTESILTLVRWNRWLTVLQLPSSLLLSEQGVTKFMDILLGATQLQDPEGGVLKSDIARSRPWSRTLSSMQAAAAVATSPLCLQNLESLTIGAEGLKPRSLPYERIRITRFVQACCARLPRLHELHLLFIIAYRAQREDRRGELPVLEAELASLDLSSTSKGATASENPFALLPSPTIRILTLPRGLGEANSYLGNDLVECTIQNWVKNLDELSVPGYVPEWKDNLTALIKWHHPFLARLDLD